MLRPFMLRPFLSTRFMLQPSLFKLFISMLCSLKSDFSFFLVLSLAASSSASKKGMSVSYSVALSFLFTNFFIFIR